MNPSSKGGASFLSALLVGLLSIAGASPARAQRLPQTVQPEHYGLAFDLDLRGGTFSGTTEIRVMVQQATSRITLHAVDLAIQSATVDDAGGGQTVEVSVDRREQQVTLALRRPLRPGTARIRIRYTARLGDQLRGLYLSRANGRRYAISQFESSDARRAFPCFDEPSFKATFDIAATIDAGDVAISNGHVIADEPGPGPNRHTVRFSRTARMSSYLVALTVGDYSCAESRVGTIPLRVCTTPAKQPLAATATDAARRSLEYFQQYFRVKYPFGKLDLVAVPEFSAAAMENTGAIFAREGSILVDSQTASLTSRKSAFSTVAHEIAHQWFGDLVTMRWWDDLWLNEGFATWMASRAADVLHPEWHVSVDDVTDTQAALALDALATTRAVRTTVSSPDQIEASFDAIAYEKGAAILRMLERYVGAETFRGGVNQYIDEHAFRNASASDFWSAMTRASGLPIDRLLPDFLDQPGAPVLDVSIDCLRGRPRLTVQQRPFVSQPTTAPASQPVSPIRQWQVPVCYRTSTSDRVQCRVLDDRRVEWPLAGDRCPQWALANADGRGYFRVAYPPAMLPTLARAPLSVAEQLVVASDEWALVRAGTHTLADYLTVATELVGGGSSALVAEVGKQIRFIYELVADSETRPAFARSARRLLAPLAAELGPTPRPGESDERRALRSAVFETMGTIGADSRTTDQLRALVEDAARGRATLDPSSAPALVAAVAQGGDRALWDLFDRAARRAPTPEVGIVYWNAAARFNDPALASLGLARALTADVRPQDIAAYLGRYLSNPSVAPQAWAFMKAHWDDIRPKIAVAFSEEALVGSLGNLCASEARRDIEAFFTAHPPIRATRALERALERIDSCVAFSQRERPSLGAWLAADAR